MWQICSTRVCCGPRSTRPLAPSTRLTSSARMRFWKAASRAARSCWRAGSDQTTGLIGRSIQGSLLHRSGNGCRLRPRRELPGLTKTGGLFRMIRMFLAAAIASACVVDCASIATAQGSYPEKPLQLIVPFPAGGASDVVGRIVAGELEMRLGKPVIVLNRPGGGTVIAAKEAANAAPDGYTLFSSSNSTFTLQNAVKENVPYDSAKDFEPIAQTGTITMVLVTHRDNPIKDVAALVAAAKANPDKLSLASFGVATISHFAGELFKSSAGIKMVHLPYRGWFCHSAIPIRGA